MSGRGIMRPMTKPTAALLTLALLTLTAPGRTTQDTTRKGGGGGEEFRALVERECEAVLENQTQFLDKVWADDMLLYTTDGKVTPKSQARQYLRTALPQTIAGLCRIVEFNVRQSGKKATVSGVLRINKAETARDPVPLRFRFTQEMVRRRGEWQAVKLEFAYVK